MSIFYRYFPPSEVKTCLRTLDQVRALFVNSLYSAAADNVLKKVRTELLDETNKPKLLKLMSEAGNSPRDVVLFAMVMQCDDLLSSGHYHICRGILSGPGQGMHAVFDIALIELVKSGFVNEEKASEHRSVLRRAIKSRAGPENLNGRISGMAA